jgi:cholesterol oxidase
MAANFWDPAERLYGLYDVWSFRKFDALVSSGLGGGSLIYANVLLRKPKNWFPGAPEGGPADGPESWPLGYDELDEYYKRAEAMLGVSTYPYVEETLKTREFRDAAGRAGLNWKPAPLAVTFSKPGEPMGLPIVGDNLHGVPRYTCRLCGQCDLGCNFGSKNTTDVTYLSVAVNHGAEVRTLHEAKSIRPDPAGGYVVEYIQHDPDDRLSMPCPQKVRAKTVVLAAGTFGSTYLLLTSRARLPRVSPRLGSRFSGNGDYLGFLTGSHYGELDSSSAPVITGMVTDDRDPAKGRGFIVQDGGYPLAADWVGEAAGLPRRALGLAGALIRARLSKERRARVSSGLVRALGDSRISRSTMPMLGMGRDRPEGVLRLGRAGDLEADWKMDSSTAVHSGIRAVMAKLAHQLDSRFRDGPSSLLSRMITVHPLGGCPMGRDAAEGVVDDHGEVHRYAGLFVADGSVLPGPAGANPSLTIAALAERFSERILERIEEGAP